MGMQKPEVTPEVTAKMPTIRTSISGKADVIEAEKKEKSPFDKSQISSQGVLKLNVRFLDSVARDLHFPLTNRLVQAYPIRISGKEIRAGCALS